jgi:hypothetical protein
VDREKYAKAINRGASHIKLQGRNDIMIARKLLSILFLSLAMIAPDFNPCAFAGLAAQEKPKKDQAEKEKPRIVDRTTWVRRSNS